MSADYATRKALNAEHHLCIRAGCRNLSRDDCLLCTPCSDDHRERNKRSYLRLHAKNSRQLRFDWWAFVRNRSVGR